MYLVICFLLFVLLGYIWNHIEIYFHATKRIISLREK